MRDPSPGGSHVFDRLYAKKDVGRSNSREPAT